MGFKHCMAFEDQQKACEYFCPAMIKYGDCTRQDCMFYVKDIDVVEADTQWPHRQQQAQQNGFQFTPLREGRPSEMQGLTNYGDVSIHAPA